MKVREQYRLSEFITWKPQIWIASQPFLWFLTWVRTSLSPSSQSCFSHSFSVISSTLTQQEWHLSEPNSQSVWSRISSSRTLSSDVPLRPEADWLTLRNVTRSVDVLGGVGVSLYWLISIEIDATPIALRVRKPMPWSWSAGSGLSESCLFCYRCKSVRTNWIAKSRGEPVCLQAPIVHSNPVMSLSPVLPCSGVLKLDVW